MATNKPTPEESAAKMLGDCARRTLADLENPDCDLRMMAERNRQLAALAKRVFEDADGADQMFDGFKVLPI